MSADRVQPTAQNASSSTTTRPRTRAGANSLTSVEATGSSAPSPRPMRNRNTSSEATDQASAASPVATPKTSRVSAKTCRRPIRSASSPPNVAPSAIPTKPIEPIQDSSVGVSDHWTASAAITKEMRPTSIASSAQPRPEPTTSRPCSRVNGSRSSRCARVAEVVGASVLTGGRLPRAGRGHAAGGSAVVVLVGVLDLLLDLVAGVLDLLLDAVVHDVGAARRGGERGRGDGDAGGGEAPAAGAGGRHGVLLGSAADGVPMCPQGARSMRPVA